MINNSFTRNTDNTYRITISVIAIFIILFFHETSAGNNYYFSTSIGDDSRTSIQAQNPATPWQTINKLNTIFSSLLPGDSVLFRRNEEFYGTIIINKSGLVGNPIVISAYETGNSPIITGFQTINNWTNEGNGIYSKAITCQSTPNVVIVDGINTPIGRYPNTGYLTIDSHVSNTSITDAVLNSSITNWTNAEVVIRKNHWILDRNTITNHTGSTLTYNSGSEYSPVDGFGYFVQNDRKCLDILGEWSYQSGKLYMFFGTSDPNSHSVRISVVDKLLIAISRNFIAIDNVSFAGANYNAINLLYTSDIVVKNCNFKFSGDCAIYANSTPTFIISHCSLSDNNNNAIMLVGTSPNSEISYNTISNTGSIPGMGKSGDWNYQGISNNASNVLISNNSIFNTGYVGIWFNGSNVTVKNNYLDTYCFVKDDGGGVYTGDSPGHFGKKIIGNIVINGPSASEATGNFTEGFAHGLYIEGYPQQMLISNNTCAHNSGMGMFLHFTQDVEVRENTCYDNGIAVYFSYNDATRVPIRTTNLYHNIFVARNVTQKCLEFSTFADDIALFGMADSNYYYRPLDNKFVFTTYHKESSKLFWDAYDLSKWKATYGKDQHSIMPVLAFQEYTFNNVIGNNKVINGTFNSNYSGFGASNSTSNWSNQTGLDAGHIALSIPSLPSSSTNLATLNTHIGAVDSVNNYIVRFSSVGVDTSKIIGVYLRQLYSPWNALTPIRYVEIKNSRSEHEILFSHPRSENNTALYFNYRDSDATISLDNIQVFNADVNITDPDDVIRFEYNETSENKTIILNDTYIGVDSTVYNGSLTLLPYTSVVLMKSIDTSTNNIPNIQGQGFQINENSPNGYLVGNVLASDPDTGQTLSYSILSGNTNGAFTINTSTGVLTVANSAALNYEAIASFALVVKVQDNGTGNLSSQAVITITLLDINEAPDIYNQSFSIVENAANGTAVGTVLATDPDAGQIKIFSILSGNTSGAFAINASTGNITVANSAILNFEVIPTFALVVKVQDNGTGNLSSQATMTISLLDANEPPVINNQSFTLAENTVNGTTVGTVTASDPDAGQTKTFSILSGNTNGAFTINGSTGVLIVANSSALNFEAIQAFTLLVKVQDNGVGNLSSQAIVTVSLLDINEPPLINNQSFAIAENSANGTNIGTVIASDPDAGQTKTFSILSGNTNGAFSINSSSGILTVANSSVFNFEANPGFSLLVKVQDNGAGNLSSQATIIISLIDVNESPVVNNQSFIISEFAPNGSLVGTVSAVDPDAGQTLSYQITSGNTSNAFSINSSTGELTVANSPVLNFTVNPTFSLNVKVTDNGTGNLFDDATITINLTQSLNQPPVITNQAFSANENSIIGTYIGTVIASDPDAGQLLIYSLLSGNTNGAFGINPTTGVLSVANSSALNFEINPSFLLVVAVQDNGTGNLTSQATVSISLLDLNEAPIVNNQTFSVSEFAANGTLVGNVTATDPDSGQTLSYLISSGNTNNAFSINTLTGELTVNNSSALNFTINPSFSLVITVTDNGPGNLSDAATITVNLLQTPNLTPVINDQSFSVNENSASGTLLGTVIAYDPNAGQTISYSILSGNTNGAFAVNASTGVLTVANSSAINFETHPVFSLVVQVQDNGVGYLSSQAIMTVSVININEVPVINNQAFSIAENSVNGTPVGTVIATDPDTGQLINFTILSGNTNGAFSINVSTGVLTVANSSALNFEIMPSYSLVIEVQDNGTGNLSDQAIITVSVQDVNEPPVLYNQSFAIAENSVNGTAIGTVIASDPDAGQTKSFSIFSGNTNGAFAINSATGLLTVANSAALDFEVTPTFNLVIKVQDNGAGNLSSQATVTITLLNVNEAPLIYDQSFNVLEFASNGTFVGTVIANDPDAGQTLSYQITSGNMSNAFLINPSTGELTVGNSNALDSNTNPAFSLIIKVIDNGTGNFFDDATVTIHVVPSLNLPPVINNQSFSLNENSSFGTVVGHVIASDPDAGQNILYSIISGNISGAFAIDAVTGKLTVSNEVVLDFESNPDFTLIIQVQDNGIGNLSSQATIYVSLFDVNETPVIVNQSFSVNENSQDGTYVGTVIASDPDLGQNITFSIASGNTNEAFSINPGTGDLSVANSSALDFETYPDFELTIKVQDNGAVNLINQAAVTVTLVNMNEPPVIDNQTFNLNENSANGTVVGTVIATDPDDEQMLAYSILSGNTNNDFAINATTGVITVADSTALNFEFASYFELLINVQDNGTGNLNNQGIVTINLVDLNEPPVINDQFFSLNENSPNGSLVGTVLATDPDQGQNLTFSILSVNTGEAFNIDTYTGNISVQNSSMLDFETSPTFTLVVNVKDNGTGNLSSQAMVTISLLDINEPPSINNQSFSITENSTDGTIIGNVLASDPDAGQTINYSILAGNTDNAFEIDSLSGEITVADSAALDFETTPSYDLIVEVQDNGPMILSSQAVVEILVLNINEPPVITDQTYCTFEHQPVGTVVSTIQASDPDSGKPVTFSISAGNFGNGFSINANSGCLSINNPNAVCYEGHPVFNLTVAVQDNEGSSSDALVTINVEDINENPVCHNQVFNIVENAPSQTIIGTIIATEPDFNQTLTYSIVAGNLNNAFAVNASNGVLEVNNSAALNFEQNCKYMLTVSVQDNGLGNLTTFSTITIKLLDINEPPVMENQVFSVIENSASGTEIGYLVANDPDNGQNLKFAIVGGNDNQTFYLDATSGLLSVSDPTKLVYAINPAITLLVIAQDNGIDTLSTLSIVTINLLQANSGGLIYIDPTNITDPLENGSIQHPFDSWEDVSFASGNTYLQKRGTTFIANKPISIINKENIILDAYGSGVNPIISYIGPEANTISIENSQNSTIQNLEIYAGLKGLACININGGISLNMTIENCRLHEAQYGIRSISEIKEFRILNTTIDNVGLDGISAHNFKNIEIGKCKINSVNHIWLTDQDSKGSCIDLSSVNGKVYIHDNVLDHSETGSMSVVRAEGNSLNGIIEGNALRGRKISGNNCLSLNNSNGTFIVRYNTIEGGGTGVDVNVTSCKLYYNQLIENSIAIKVQQYKAVDVLNNTFYGNVNYSIESYIGSKVTSKNNIYYLTPDGSQTYKFGGSYNSDFNTFNVAKPGFLNGYNTILSWIAASGQDRNSLVTDPLFENIPAGNFRIKPNSPCINKGSDLGLEKDFFATMVPQAGVPDIGFCEVNAESIQEEKEIIPVSESISLIDISVHPNPSAGLVKIGLKKVGDEEVNIRILNMSGYEIYSSVTKGQEEVVIDFEKEKTGMYLAVIMINRQVFTRHIMIQN